MIKFTCKNEECPNVDVEYNFNDDIQYAECGGCKNILIAELSDVEPITPLVPKFPESSSA
jgi:ribosomal protein L32E